VTDPRKWTRAILVALVLAPGAAIAEEAGGEPSVPSVDVPSVETGGDGASPEEAVWTPMTGPEIWLVLGGVDVAYGDLAWERHEPRGILLFRTVEGIYGATSIGQWDVQGDARCLRWNRAAEWECYTVETDGADGIRFTDAFGNVSEGRLVPRVE
jgi:hypothetical protein